MAVRVPTTTRVCLSCKKNSDANAEKEFHELFDEVGLELQLPFLVKTFFHIELIKRNKQHLCDDCVNRLIELYDLAEHAKEESWVTNNLKNKQECCNNDERSEYLQKQSGSFRYQRQNFHKAFVINPKNTQVTLPKSNNIECTNFETYDSTEGENAVEINKHNILSLSSSAIKDKKLDKLESNELMEFIIDDGNQNVKINKPSNRNILVRSKKLEIEEYQIKSNEEIEVLSEIKSETKENGFLYSGQNEFVEENVCEEFINSGDSNSLLEELKITKEHELLLLNASRSATEFNNIEHTDADDFFEQEDMSEDITFEEEYLTEEIIWSQEYDQVDLNKYLDKVLITKFQDLLLSWEVECKLCLKIYYSFVELLNHACMAECDKEQELSCIVNECEEHAKDLPTLARHLVLKHYDKLESTAIYSKCTDCQQIFSNILDFNKHSCCRNIKRKMGAPKYCKYCDLDFQSLRRYVFHMQFHLKNHRPKICLLCGDLFNNSNDFFEHTQYKHNPKTALACVRCDLFFKDIQVLNNHMEMHSKYLHNCELCPKKYTSKFQLHQHMNIYHNNNSDAFQCEYCPKKFGYKHSYVNHINKTHATEAKVQTFICSTCGVITKNMETMKDHIESDNESPCFSSPVEEKILGLCYSCEGCSLDFCTIKHLKDHRLSDSHSKDLFHCGICRKTFNNFKVMRKHFKNHKDFKEWQESFPITRRFVCNIGDCEKCFPTYTCLYRHMRHPHKTEEETNSSTEFKCHFCQQLYPSNKGLSSHITKIHKNVNFKCSHCKKNFNSQNLLQKHINKFHTPVECDICLKIFKSGRNLQRHIDCVHNNIKRFFCKHCQKGYYYKKEKNFHEKQVHPENTFKCKLCSFVTSYPSSFEIHMDRHNNRLKLKCPICSKSFGRKHLLKSHLERHQNKKE